MRKHICCLWSFWNELFNSVLITLPQSEPWRRFEALKLDFQIQSKSAKHISVFEQVLILFMGHNFYVQLGIGSILEFLVLKNLRQRTSRRVKCTSGARIMIGRTVGRRDIMSLRPTVLRPTGCAIVLYLARTNVFQWSTLGAHGAQQRTTHAMGTFRRWLQEDGAI